ncbi:MAG: transposase [Acetomicrobium sp.]|nr:transposase [Acetomicrobium sp.]MDR9769752.1 transposase [Acetomicrobium sp.]
MDFYRKSFDVPVVVAMEGHGGYGRPLDSCVQESGYTLLNVNNLKLCRFKEIFSSPAKTDAIDARKIALLARTQDVCFFPLIKKHCRRCAMSPKNTRS